MTRKWFASAILLISAGGERRASEATARAKPRERLREQVQYVEGCR